ncbi:MAG: FAD-dependent oxidoreductase [Candidatus Viridilinea halotolerans]|uniref:FAD-dependent oxidoreductase n=1 Tax=Candidatus Viridilinea halotolerans TaxID=2491704 RepID=A0A426TRI6_9CHLR|nr:MAG: FAD-dependent oxidoreductase [Candidatus Viridilinea halotolerans]
MTARYVIVGAGVAGIAAAERLRALAPAASIMVITDDPAGFYSRPGLAYFLSDLIPEDQLFPRSPAELRALGLTWITERAVGLDPHAHHLTLADGRTLTYDKLLLATGATAAPPDFPGGDLDGVVTLDSLEDARQIVRRARRGTPAVVVGGGITALELAEGLHARGCHVHYLLRGDRYWANVLDAEESQLVEGHLRALGIHIHHHTRILQALGERGRVASVETATGERIACQLLAVAIGTRPRLELARSGGLATERGILADEYLETSAADVLAAGDVAQVYDEATGRATLDTLWATARAHGAAAAMTMTGTPTAYRRSVAQNVTLLAGIPTTIIGAMGGSGDDTDLVAIARGDSERWRTALPDWVVVEQHTVNRVRLMLNERALVGAIVMGDQRLAYPLQRLIAARADITPIHAALLADGAPVVQLVADYFSAWERTYAKQP